MQQAIIPVALVVRDYDEAIAFYRFSSEKAPLFTGEMNRFVDLLEFVDNGTMSTR